MARAGLDSTKVVDTAALIADRDGLEALSLGGLARELSVKPPSLYNHVANLEALQRALYLKGLVLLDERLQRVAVGKSGPDALRALASAYREFAKTHPGLYTATLRTVEDRDDEIKQAGYRVLETFQAVLAGFGLEGDAALHATRAVRAAVSGFVELELRGSFGMPLNVEESFEYVLELLVGGLESER